MSTTAQDVITQALIEIGAYASGETPSSADLATGLSRFGGLIDAWGADLLTIYTTQRTLFTLTSGTSTVTIGATGTIAVARPTFWIGVNYVVPGTNPAVETPMGRMDDDSFMNLSIKALPSSLPTQWYYNATFPNGTLFFWPTVTQNVQLALYFPLQVSVPVNLTDVVDGPPGYFNAMLYNLALMLTTPFSRNLNDLPALPKLAADSFAIMRRPNVDPGLLGVDNALVPYGGGAYNVLNDQLVSPSSR